MVSSKNYRGIVNECFLTPMLPRTTETKPGEHISLGCVRAHAYKIIINSSLYTPNKCFVGVMDQRIAHTLSNFRTINISCDIKKL